MGLVIGQFSVLAIFSIPFIGILETAYNWSNTHVSCQTTAQQLNPLPSRNPPKPHSPHLQNQYSPDPLPWLDGMFPALLACWLIQILAASVIGGKHEVGCQISTELECLLPGGLGQTSTEHRCSNWWYWKIEGSYTFLSRFIR